MRSKRTIAYNWLFPAFALLFLTVCLRFFSFFPAVISNGNDESTYILIAREMLHGKHYFVDVIDIKPIGIFLIYAIFQDLIGDSIFQFRLLGALWVGLTAFGLFVITVRFLSGRAAGWIAGVGYIFMTSLFTNYGVTPSTQLYFNGCVVIALFWLLGGIQWWRFVLAGGVLGIGFMFDYVVAADALAFGWLVIWLAYHGKGSLKAGVLRSLVMLLSFSIPIGLAWFYYWLLDHELEFLYFTFEVPGRYPVVHDWGELTSFFLVFFLQFLPLTGMALFAMTKGKRLLNELWPFFGIWLFLDALVIVWSGQTSGNYFIQLMPALCLLAGVGYVNMPAILKWWEKQPKSRQWSFGLLVIFVLMYFQKKKYYDSRDQTRAVAEFLSDRLKPGDQIYTGNYHHILYFLLERETPTPYVHQSLLWEDRHVKALEIDLEKEAGQILELQPRFLTMEKPVPNNLLADSLFRHYQPIAVFGDRITVYERKKPAN